jgi:hypothetical protein
MDEMRNPTKAVGQQEGKRPHRRLGEDRMIILK